MSGTCEEIDNKADFDFDCYTELIQRFQLHHFGLTICLTLVLLHCSTSTILHFLNGLYVYNIMPIPFVL